MSGLATLVSLGAVGGLAGYGIAVEPRWFQLRHLALRPLRRPPRPFRVLQVSDCHFLGGQPWKERFLTSLAAHPVDFVVLLGDLIEDDSGIDPLIRALGALRPRYGAYCVLGAHDFLYPGFGAIVRDVFVGGRNHTSRNDSKRLMRELRGLGVHIFRNDGFVLEPGPQSPFPAPIFLCGINDAFSGWDDVPRAVRNRPDGMYTLMLTHALHEYDDIVAAAPDVCFAGHAHGGQVRIPYVGAVITRSNLPARYARGWFRLGRTTFHLNHGMGAGRWTHVRFNCRPEASLLDVH